MTRKELGRFVFFATGFSTRDVGGGWNDKGLRSLILLDEMQTGTILFFHLLYRNNSAAESPTWALQEGCAHFFVSVFAMTFPFYSA